MAIHGEIESIDVLNIDTGKSTISGQELVLNNNINNESFVVSDVDEELLILIQFKKQINLKSIKIYSFKKTIDNMEENMDVSPPKQISIYKIDNLNVNFSDLSSIKCHKKINCNTKKIRKRTKYSFTKNINQRG
eukprot:513343_1